MSFVLLTFGLLSKRHFSSQDEVVQRRWRKWKHVGEEENDDNGIYDEVTVRLQHSPDAGTFPGFELTCFVYIKCISERSNCSNF
jgi:hypothetical protein